MKFLQKLPIICLILLLLTGCVGKQEPEAPATVPETTVPATVQTVPTEAPETVPVTQPPVETLPPETQPPEEPARRIKDAVSFRNEQIDVTRQLNDSDHRTSIDLYSTRRLFVTSEEPFAAMYFSWDILPGAFTISWEGGSMEFDDAAFLHDYVRLPEAVTSVVISFPGHKHIYISDISLYTEGPAPEEVQLWLPPCEEADILVFPTHSDDDTLFFGALISQYAIEEELTVQTAFMVKHAWRTVRSHERLNGLWEMGIRHYPILGDMVDCGSHSMEAMEALHRNDDLKGWQVEQIRRFKPLVVVGHDLDGEYGNGQHKLNAHYLTDSVLIAQDPEQYPETAQQYGVWTTPKLYLHLYEENALMLDVNTPMEKDPEGRTPFEVAEDAYEHHVSQHIYAFYVSQDDYEKGMDCKRFGLYHSLVGQDTGSDIMENIDPGQWR